MTLNPIRPTLALAVCISVLTSCGGGEKHIEVVERFKPKYEELRAELAELAKQIPEKVAPTAAVPILDPKPEFKDKKLASNTVIVMYEQLVDPDINLQKEQKLDFYYDNNLVRFLQWTGPGNPMADRLKKRKAPESLERQMQYPLDLRYLGVVRTLKHERAVATSKDSFNGGGAVLGLFLVDRNAKAIVAQGMVVARPNAKVEYKYSESSDPVAALSNWANSSIWENARKATIEKFTEISGGAFQ